VIQQDDPRLKRLIALHAGLRGWIKRLDQHNVFKRDQPFSNGKHRHGNLPWFE
jgi:hypothetical protein